MADVVGKEQCPECVAEGGDSSGDNLALFDDGKRYCYAGHGYVDNSSPEEKEEAPSIQPGMDSGTYSDIGNRGITRKTCVKYGYQVANSPKRHIANFYDAAGNVVLQKVRKPGKDFVIHGNKDHTRDLYGSWLFTPDERVFITITEGELDCLSVAEVFNCRYPVVSLPNGAQSAAAVITKNKAYLDGFKYVVLAFDSDDAGVAAVNACLPILEPGKVRIAKWTDAKDASDLLQQGRGRELVSAVYDAIEYLPEPIITGDRLLDSLNDYQTKTKAWPWENANKAIAPIYIPAVYTIAAKPAVGKTLFASELMRMFMQGGGKVGIIALEETIQKVLLKMTSALCNVDLLAIRNRELTHEEKELCRAVASKLVIYDHITYGSDINTIVQNIPYMVRSCGCEVIIFDNLSYSATGLASNERVGIDKAMVKLKDSTVKYEYTLLNVCHLKRDDGFFDQDKPLTAESIRGSQGVEMYSDYIIGLQRATSSDSEIDRNTLKVHVLKDRMSGQDTGQSFNLYYNQGTGRLEDTNTDAEVVFGGVFT